MSIYYNASGETKEIDDATIAQWIAAGNPKASAWTLRPDPPAYDPQTHSCSWDGAQWVVAAIQVVVPDEVSALAFELTLNDLGLLTAVLAYVDTLPAVEQIYWRRRDTMRRDSTLIEAGRVALGLTAGQVDSLFIAAGNRQT